MIMLFPVAPNYMLYLLCHPDEFNVYGLMFNDILTVVINILNLKL